LSYIAPHRRVWGLVPAGGRGQRFGGDTPKQLISIAGKPVLAWTIDRLLSSGLAGLTVALPAEWLPKAKEILPADDRISWVPGGATRQLSVEACLRTCPPDTSLVLVHDGARPVVSRRDLLATVEAVGDADGAILGRPLADTLKKIEGGRILSTVDRSSLFRAETPQVFKTAVLTRALQQCAADGFVGTDEASIVERLDDVSIRVVAATGPNPKLTEPQDLPWVRSLLEEKGES